MFFIPKGNDLYGYEDDQINGIVEDYRDGFLSDSEFSHLVGVWKDNWKKRIADIVPGHKLDVLVHATTGKPLFRLTPKEHAAGLENEDTIPDHLKPQKVRGGGYGPTR